jgi:hypothetical protein
VLGGDVAGFTVDDGGGIVDVDVARRHGGDDGGPESQRD